MIKRNSSRRKQPATTVFHKVGIVSIFDANLLSMTKHLACVFLFLVVLGLSASAQRHIRFSDVKVGMVDEELAQQGVQVANTAANKYGWPEEYKKAVIISRAWAIERDSKEKKTGRLVHMEIYCTNRVGKCKMSDFTFRQKYLGDHEYSPKLSFVSCGDLYEIDCDE